MLAIHVVLLALSAVAFAFIGTWGLLKLSPVLTLDVPGERTSHAAPTPRGGGLAVTVTMVFFLISALANHWFVAGLVLVGAISWADDRKPQPVLRRLAIHILAAGLAVMAIHQPVFHGLLPLMLDKAVSALILVYAMNVYNFMDGIDEMTVAETVTIGLGLAAMVWCDYAQELPGAMAIDGMIVAGSAVGFWFFNRHPAKIFLGDVGSVPLGLASGFLILMLASQGAWAAALILPSYYLIDASSTLLLRLLSGERIWQAHRRHAYQRAVQRGRRHDTVSRAVLALGLCLICLASLSILPGMAWPMLAAGYASSLLFTLWLRFGGSGDPFRTGEADSALQTA